MSMKKDVVDLQLHMAVKTLAILQGEINCKLDELIKKVKLMQEREEVGEEASHLLDMTSDNLKELVDLFEQRKNLRSQIENLKKIQMDLIKG